MSRSTDEVIAALTADVRPVTRLRPPMARASGWLAILLIGGGAAVWLWADPEIFGALTATWFGAAAWAASVAAGAAALVAAAHLSLPDRSRAWALAPIPFVLLWLGLSGIGCLGLPASPDPHSGRCFVFILEFGLPVGGFLFWRLSRAHPINGAAVAAVGALAAACLTAALLQFFHPFAITWLDLGLHLAALGVLMALGAVAGRLSGAGPARLRTR